MSRSIAVVLCLLGVFLAGCGRESGTGHPELKGAMRDISDRWKAARAFSDFEGIRELVRKGASPEYTKDVLGEPLEIADQDGKLSWLYVRAAETPDTEFDWWLTFGPDGTTAGWLAKAQAENTLRSPAQNEITIKYEDIVSYGILKKEWESNT